MGEEYLKYRIALLDRYIPYLWKILNKQMDMPAIFIYQSNSCCKACQGSGKVNNVPCTVCKSSGKIPLSTKQQYNNIFKKFVRAKKDKEYFEQALRDRQFEAYQELEEAKEARPNKKDWVCLKCARNFDGTKGTEVDTCFGCVNYKSGDAQGKEMFVPVSKTAAKWYKEKGHKLNFNYQDKLH